MSDQPDAAPDDPDEMLRRRDERPDRAASGARSPEGPRRPRTRSHDASVRGGIVGITAVIAATALLTLAGVLIALVVTLIY